LVESSPATPPTNGPLHLEQSSLDRVLQPPPNGVVRKSAFNAHARVAQNYNIVEDLAQEPSAMSALEVLQSCPAKWKALLKAIGGIDPTDTNLIVFDLEDHIPRLPLNLHSRYKWFFPTKTFVEPLLTRVPQRVLCLLLVGNPLALLL
jgi:hypothetical protein